MSRKLRAGHGVVCRMPDSDLGYFGWPSVARTADGTLVMAVSGPRHRHVCPWGKDSLCFSRDDGKTWSAPLVVHDSPLDDRDAGIVALGGQALLLTWFTLDPRQFHERYRRDMSPEMAAWMEARLSALTEEAVAASAGSWTRLSLDGGRTWSAPRKAPVTAPHGPILTRDGALLYAGKPFPSGALRPLDEPVAVYRSQDRGASWAFLGPVPLPDGFQADQVHEPHLAFLPDGTLLCALRVHEKDTLATWMSRSADGGHTWGAPYRLPCDGTPPHLLLHSSGRVVCVYGYRNAPYGQRALVSRDGLHWGEEIILRRDGPTPDLGYPASVELADGSLLTVYYQLFPGDKKPSVLYTRWQLPEE